jgi:hypothetical protein
MNENNKKSKQTLPVQFASALLKEEKLGAYFVLFSRTCGQLGLAE